MTKEAKGKTAESLDKRESAHRRYLCSAALCYHSDVFETMCMGGKTIIDLIEQGDFPTEQSKLIDCARLERLIGRSMDLAHSNKAGIALEGVNVLATLVQHFQNCAKEVVDNKEFLDFVIEASFDDNVRKDGLRDGSAKHLLDALSVHQGRAVVKALYDPDRAGGRAVRKYTSAEPAGTSLT